MKIIIGCRPYGNKNLNNYIDMKPEELSDEVPIELFFSSSERVP